jgi:hypothetical protein
LSARHSATFKTLADFRHDNSKGISNVCCRFVQLCRELKLFTQAIVAVDSSKFKAVNSRDRNFTPGKVDKRQEQIEESIQRYLKALETVDSLLEQLWRRYGNTSAAASELIVPRPARATGLHTTPVRVATGASTVPCASRAHRRCDG